MDLQLILLINVAALSVLTIILILIRRTPGAGSMLFANGLVLATAALGWFLIPQHAGTIAVCVALLLIAGPGILINRSFRAALLGQWARAARLSRLAAVLHPTGAYRFNARLLAALAIELPENRLTALSDLQLAANPDQARLLEAHRARLLDDWQGALTIVRQTNPVRPELRLLELRALGETGRLDEMVRAYDRARMVFSGIPLLVMQLDLFAFTGRRSAADRLINEHLPRIDPQQQAYWQAVAAERSDDDSQAAAHTFAELAKTAKSLGLRQAALRHYHALSEDLPVVSETSARSLDYFEHRQSAMPSRQRFHWRQSPVTWLLLIVIGAVFGAEMALGGSEDNDTLFRMGALWTPSVLRLGEWWRLVAAMFLHFGPVHLVFNALALLLFGAATEARYGSWRMLVIYGLGGLVSMGTIITATSLGWIKADIAVGASGAIMALLGAEGARRLMIWLKDRDPLDRQMFLMVVLVVALQSGLDLIIPAVSFTGHLSGVIAGALIGLGFLWLGRSRDRRGLPAKLSASSIQ